MKQRGFIELPILGWAAIAAGVVIAGLCVSVYIQTLRLGAVKSEFATFRGGVEALGHAAEEAAKAKEAADKKRKEDADAKLAKYVALHADALKRLRDAKSSGSFVPAAPAGSSRPDLACFDRAEYQRADGVFTEGARSLADEGTASTLGLDVAKGWAQQGP